MNERQIISLATKDSAFGLNAMGIFLFGGAMAGLTGAAIKPRSERMFLLFLGLLQEATGKSTGKRISQYSMARNLVNQIAHQPLPQSDSRTSYAPTSLDSSSLPLDRHRTKFPIPPTLRFLLGSTRDWFPRIPASRYLVGVCTVNTIGPLQQSSETCSVNASCFT